MKQLIISYVEEGTAEEAERLLSLLATGLQRFLAGERPGASQDGLDLSPDLSVHTDDHHQIIGEPS